MDGSTSGLQALRDDDAGSAKHGPASVDELGGAVLVHLAVDA